MAFSPAEEVLRIGLFELDVKAGQHRRNGARIRLPQQPVQVLAALLERPGQVITREELRQRLWSPDTFVDFDHGLNKSIQKLRDALGDSSDSLRYIETIPRVGYRFIAPVIGEAAQNANHIAAQVVIPENETVEPTRSSGARKVRWLAIAACVAVLGAVIAGWLLHKKQPQIEPIHSLAVLPLDNLSGDPLIKKTGMPPAY